MQPRAQETLQGTIKRLLDQGYVRVAGRTIEAIVASTNDPRGIIQQRLRELDAEVARLESEDITRLPPDNPVIRALLADLETVMGRNQSRVDAAGDDVQGAGVDVAGTLTRQLAFPGMTDDQVRLLAVGREWASADPEVVQRLVQYVDGAAWAEELSVYGDDVLRVVGNQAIFGMAQGWHPIRVAREMRKKTERLPASAANTLMRTLYLQTYRDGTTIHQNANVQLINRVVRIESLDSRICAACVYRHGEVVWDRERDGGQPILRIDEHHNGRGTTVTEVIGARPLAVRRGEEWFKTLRDDQQREIIQNDSAHRAYKAGAVQLQDFVKPYEDRVFGSMMRQASLTDMLGAGAKDWYQ